MSASWLDRVSPPPGGATAASPAASAKPETAPEGKAYRAWGRGHPESSMLDVRIKPERGTTGHGKLLPLHYLLGVDYTDSPSGDLVTLAFADCLVTLRGSGLGGIRDALTAGKVDFIEQYDSRRWPALPVDEPIVKSIEVVAPGRPRAV